MSAHGTAAGWELTDEEWCELCFMVIDMDGARERLERTLLAEERPTLHQLWTVLNAYQQSSDGVSSYLARRLRIKAGIEQQAA